MRCMHWPLSAVSDMPVLLHNYPGRMVAEMDADFLDRIGQSSNFRAIKESSGDINRLHLLARNYPQIGISCGMDDQALEFFCRARASWVCAAQILRQKHISHYGIFVVEGDLPKAALS